MKAMKSVDIRKLIVGIITVLVLIALSTLILYRFKRPSNEEQSENTQQQSEEKTEQTPKPEEKTTIAPSQPNKEIQPEKEAPIFPESTTKKESAETKSETKKETPIAGPEMPVPITDDAGD